MRTYDATLSAGQAKTLTVNGNFFALINAVGAVDLEFQYVGTAGTGGFTEVSAGMVAGYSEIFPGQMTQVTVTSSIAQTIRYGCGNGNARFDASTIITKQATSQTETAPATVGVAAASVLAGSATRQRIIFTADAANGGDIYLGGSTVTTVNSAIKLGAGESWIEERAAGAAWYAIASAAGQTLRINTAE